MAIPLFIFAATVCRFVRDQRCGDPEEQLAKILKDRTRSQGSKLDATYLPVLSQLLVGLSASEKERLVEEFQEVVGSIIILANPLSASSLSHLVDIPKRVVEYRLDLLHSALNIPPEPESPVRLLHVSFRDFLLDPEKRGTSPFWVDELIAHRKIATSCLRILSTGGYLKKDICNLQKPGKPRAEVDKRTMDACLPAHVRYACLYWVHHLTQSNGTICDRDQAHRFLTRHFLHWLEALSLLARMPDIFGIINDLQTMVKVRNPLETFLRKLTDNDTAPGERRSVGLHS
jgi:hypothetical protein